jgi:parallel beta-helix repeat protein
MVSRSLVYAAVAAVSIAWSGAASAQRALPTQFVECGQTITQSLRVANNLNCAFNGLNIGANGVTIDLGGHVLVGAGDPNDHGIDNQAGFDGVTIRNGAITGFDAGVIFNGVDGGEISNLQIAGSTAMGIRVTSSTRIVVADNVVRGSEVNGMVFEDLADSLVRDNLLVGNTLNGMIFLLGSTRNRIQGNRSLGNTGGGFNVQGSTANVLKKNVAMGNGAFGFGLTFAAVGNQLRGNTASANTTHGLLMLGSSENVVRANAFTGNSQHGVQIEDSSNNVVQSNRAIANNGVGLRVIAGSGNALTRNQALENRDAGVLSDTTAVTVSKNTADRNGFFGGSDDDTGLGIDVPAGTAGGGNRASDNDDPAECAPAELCN